MFKLKLNGYSLVRANFALKLCGGFLLLAFFQQMVKADVNNNDPYALPPSKEYVKSCKHEVLRLHVGQIEKEQLLHRHGAFLLQYTIRADDDSEWVVLCDITTGKIVKEQKLIDDISP
jgi:hypothetical protein